MELLLQVCERTDPLVRPQFRNRNSSQSNTMFRESNGTNGFPVIQ